MTENFRLFFNIPLRVAPQKAQEEEGVEDELYEDLPMPPKVDGEEEEEKPATAGEEEKPAPAGEEEKLAPAGEEETAAVEHVTAEKPQGEVNDIDYKFKIVFNNYGQ